MLQWSRAAAQPHTHMHAVGSACAADDDDTGMCRASSGQGNNRSAGTGRPRGAPFNLLLTSRQRSPWIRSHCSSKRHTGAELFTHFGANRLCENQSQPFKYLINAFLRLVQV